MSHVRKVDAIQAFPLTGLPPNPGKATGVPGSGKACGVLGVPRPQRFMVHAECVSSIVLGRIYDCPTRGE